MAPIPPKSPRPSRTIFLLGLGLVIGGEVLHVGVGSYLLGALYKIGFFRLVLVVVLGVYAGVARSSVSRWVLAVVAAIWASGYIVGGLLQGGLDLPLLGVIVLTGAIMLMTPPVTRYLKKS